LTAEAKMNMKSISLLLNRASSFEAGAVLRNVVARMLA
jgi:hypothetical protein